MIEHAIIIKNVTDGNLNISNILSFKFIYLWSIDWVIFWYNFVFTILLQKLIENINWYNIILFDFLTKFMHVHLLFIVREAVFYLKHFHKLIRKYSGYRSWSITHWSSSEPLNEIFKLRYRNEWKTPWI